jgi:hypothetical protein
MKIDAPSLPFCSAASGLVSPSRSNGKNAPERSLFVSRGLFDQCLGALGCPVARRVGWS